MRFAAAVTEFGEILRESPYSEGQLLEDIQEIASQSMAESGETPSKIEFLELLEKTQVILEE